MKTKALVLAGLVSLAGVAASEAQTVYSVNAVGFVNVTIAPGAFQIIANPLAQAASDLNSLLPGAPVNTIIYKFDTGTGSFTSFTKRSSGLWTGINVNTTSFNPGEGFFVKNPDTVNPIVLTFTGEVLQSSGTPLQNSIPAGFSILASQVPVAGALESQLGFPAGVNDIVYKFVDGAYVASTRRANGSWTGVVPGDPQISVAEGFFFSNGGASKTWSRTFSVSN